MTGLALGAAIMAAWAALHVWGVFFHPLEGWGIAAAPLLVLASCWLNVGLFIVAHDCMHGSLAPGRPRLNRGVGRLALFLYAGFSYDRLLPKHFDHHRRPGTADDPDFSADHPSAFWPWYVAFLRQYFGWREWAVLTTAVAFYLLVLGAPYANLLLFWALPAILSSMQLFLFGTYLPHRVEAAPFADRHNARSTGQGRLVSLLTCFHFGYHHEHHLAPHVPWWRLPEERARRQAQASPRPDRLPA
ncbi:MAG: fatty acid desaturase [Allosphingosinicella sp.]|uniref:fatty acid desaturase n=1 Tax=Allosphingosinicella sp. TaxID=2823234 RepID=UPI003942715F